MPLTTPISTTELNIMKISAILNLAAQLISGGVQIVLAVMHSLSPASSIWSCSFACKKICSSNFKQTRICYVALIYHSQGKETVCPCATLSSKASHPLHLWVKPCLAERLVLGYRGRRLRMGLILEDALVLLSVQSFEFQLIVS